jgi:3-isopropylmalate dehydrogenase
MRTLKIAVLPGDGIGPEVVDAALKVWRRLESSVTSVTLEWTEHLAGAQEFLRSGDPLPAATLQACREAGAIFLGAMGLPDVRWPDGREMAPQLDLREQLQLYAGVRPARLYHERHTPLKGYRAGQIDLILVRESTEGMFASRLVPRDRAAEVVCDTLRISKHGADRVCRAAFRLAQNRRGLVTLIDKANVLPSMAFFRERFYEVAKEFPHVKATHVYVDACALYLVQKPEQFDVLVTENLFGDILSDLTAGLVGGMGMAPSGDIGDQHALFQPAHGSAPDIAGKGIANPIATILSLAMMLEWLQQEDLRACAARIRTAVERVMSNPDNATPDLGGNRTTGQLTEAVIAALA